MRKFIFFFIVIIITAIAYTLFDWYMRTVFTTVAMEESSKILSNCLDDALSETITSEISYDDLINIKQDAAGNIVLIQNNTIAMNLLAGNAVKKAEEKLNKKAQNGVQLPFGYLVGGQIAAEKLPEVTINFRQIGNVTSSFNSSFTQAGINQTMHTVNLTLNMDALLLIPNNNVNISSSVTIPVCETIIIGNVPTEYRQYNDVYEDNEQ